MLLPRVQPRFTDFAELLFLAILIESRAFPLLQFVYPIGGNICGNSKTMPQHVLQESLTTICLS